MIYGQRDPAWAGQRLGTADGVTLGGFGCYVTSEAMVATHFGHTINPAQLDDIYTNNNLYVQQCLIVDGSLSQVFPDIAYAGTYHCEGIAADLNQLLDCNEVGREAIIEVDFNHNPSDGIQTHFVRFNSYDPSTGVLLIDDPWYADEVNFSERYGDPSSTIQKIVKYQGPTPAPTPAPAAIDVQPVAPSPEPIVEPVSAPVSEPVPETPVAPTEAPQTPAEVVSSQPVPEPTALPVDATTGLPTPVASEISAPVSSETLPTPVPITIITSPVTTKPIEDTPMPDLTPTTVQSPNLPIHPKVVAAGLAGAVVTVIVSLLAFFNINLPGELTAAIVTLVSGLLAYLTPSN